MIDSPKGQHRPGPLPLAMLVAVAVMASGVALSADEGARCEWTKKRAAGRYSRCRLFADAAFSKNGDADKLEDRLAGCEQKLLRSFENADQRFGGACKTTGDGVEVEAFLSATADELVAFAEGYESLLGAADCGTGTTYDESTGLCVASTLTCGSGTVLVPELGRCVGEVLFGTAQEDERPGYANVGGEGYLWKRRARMHDARQDGAAAALDGNIYAFGGLGPPTAERYDPETDSWTLIAPLLPLGSTPRRYLGAAAAQGGVYAVGGWEGEWSEEAATSRVERYDPGTDTWKSVADMNVARWLLQVVSLDGLIYAIGGRGEDGNKINSMEVYDPALDRWTPLAPVPTGAGVHGATAYRGRLYVWTDASTLEEYDPRTGRWRQVSDQVASAEGQTVTTQGNRLLAFGGWNGFPEGSHSASAYRLAYGPDGPIIFETERFSMYGRYSFNGDFGNTAVTVDDRVFLVGSSTLRGDEVNEFIRTVSFRRWEGLP